MYERCVGRNLGRLKIYAGISLFVDLLFSWFGVSFGDLFLLCLSHVYPVIDGNSPFCVLLYLVSQFQAWHLALPQYIVEGRRTDTEFLGYAALFLVVTLHPFSKSIQAILFLYFFFWKKIRYSDTLVIISRGCLKNKRLLIGG